MPPRFHLGPHRDVDSIGCDLWIATCRRGSVGLHPDLGSDRDVVPRVSAYGAKLDLELEMSESMAADRASERGVDLRGYVDDVIAALYRLAAGDDTVTKILDCFGEGVLDRRDIVRATGMPAPTYDSARRRLLALVENLPQDLRDEASARWREELTMTNDQKKNLRIYEAISYESAVEASARRDGLTLAERDEARQFVDGMRMRVLHKQRADRAAARPSRVRPSILAMVREALERRFADLLATHPDAVFAHRDLTEMSDDDLRSALEDAEALVERMT